MSRQLPDPIPNPSSLLRPVVGVQSPNGRNNHLRRDPYAAPRDAHRRGPDGAASGKRFGNVRSAEAHPDSLIIATSWASFLPAPRMPTVRGLTQFGFRLFTGCQSPQTSQTKMEVWTPVAAHVPTEHSGPFNALRRSCTQTHVKAYLVSLHKVCANSSPAT